MPRAGYPSSSSLLSCVPLVLPEIVVVVREVEGFGVVVVVRVAVRGFGVVVLVGAGAGLAVVVLTVVVVGRGLVVVVVVLVGGRDDEVGGTTGGGAGGAASFSGVSGLSATPLGERTKAGLAPPGQLTTAASTRFCVTVRAV
jgi:hypothetical protein